MIRAGELKDWVSIEEQDIDAAKTEHGNTNPALGWNQMTGRNVKITPATSDERTNAQQVGEHLTHLVKMRPVGGLTTTRHRLNWKGRILNINGIIEKDRSEAIVTCGEVA